jgi:hypothetical protein
MKQNLLLLPAYGIVLPFVIDLIVCLRALLAHDASKQPPARSLNPSG